MPGKIEKRRKIVSNLKWESVYPPDKLPQIPPNAIENQDRDWRSPANEALLKTLRASNTIP